MVSALETHHAMKAQHAAFVADVLRNHTLPFAIGEPVHAAPLVAALLYVRDELTRYRFTDGYNHILDRIDATLLDAGIDANNAQERAKRQTQS